MASIHRRTDSKFWIAAFTAADGRQLKRSTKTADKKAAMQRALEFETAAQGAMTVKQAKSVIGGLMEKQGLIIGGKQETVKQWVQKFIARKKPEVSLATYRFYKSSGEKWVKWMAAKAEFTLSSVTLDDLIGYREHLFKMLSPRTVNHTLSLIRMIFLAAHNDEVIDRNPAVKLKPVKDDGATSRQPFTAAQIKSLLAVADPEWKSMILAGAFMGQRLADVATLKWETVDLDKGTAALQTRKTSRWMNLPLAPDLWQHLKSWSEGREQRKSEFPGLEEYVHPRAAGYVTRTELSGRLSNQFADLLVYAGIRKGGGANLQITAPGKKRLRHPLSFHSLRHTATSWMKAAGIPASVVMDFIGHDDAAMSRLYTHTGEEAMRKAADALPSLID